MADAKKELGKVMMTLYIIIAIFAVCIVWAIYEAAVLGDFIMMIPGLVIGFMTLVFGVPLIWLRNSERRIDLRLAVIALQNERTAFSVLAGSVGCSDAEARERIVWCLNNGYLPGYVISGNEVLLSKLMDPNLQEHAVECPNCGASFTYVGKIGQCPYCGDYYPPQKKN